MPLDQALAMAGFPDSLTALVAWGQQKNCLAEAFRAAAEAFEARTNSQTALLNMLVLPLIYMIIVTFVGIHDHRLDDAINFLDFELCRGASDPMSRWYELTIDQHPDARLRSRSFCWAS